MDSTNPFDLLSGPIYAWMYFSAITTTAFYGISCMQTFLVPAIVYVARAFSYSNGFHSVDITILNAKSLTDPITLALSVAAGEDILIATFLVFLLIRERMSTVFASTAHMLQRLTVIAVNTGMWTAMFALLTIIFMYVLPSKMIYALFALPLCSVYSNTVLANLNARAYLRDRLERRGWLESPRAGRSDSSPSWAYRMMVAGPFEDMELVTSSDTNP